MNDCQLSRTKSNVFKSTTSFTRIITICYTTRRSWLEGDTLPEEVCVPRFAAGNSIATTGEAIPMSVSQ